MRLLALIPTYNEIENIEGFIKAVFAHIPPEAEILVVDDNSPDGTARAVEKLFADYPGRLHILNRPEKQGLARAYLAGFSWGLPAATRRFWKSTRIFLMILSTSRQCWNKL